MPFILLLFAMIANTPMPMATAQANNPNTSSGNPLASSADAIRAAATAHTRFFWIYVLSLLMTAGLTYLVWHSGNKVQDEIRADADARIAEANRKVVELSIELEHEKQKTAEAQLALGQTLASFARRAGDRVLNFATFVDSLKGQPVKTVEIWYKPDDTEAERFSGDIVRALESVKWPVSARAVKPDDRLGGMSFGNHKGIIVLSRHIEDGNSFSHFLLKSLLFGGGGAATTAKELPDNKLVVVIGDRDRL